MRASRSIGVPSTGPPTRPGGTGVAISVRTGNTPTPDGSWSAFNPIASSGADVPGNSRYIQYRAQLSSSDPDNTPSLSEVTIGYTAGRGHHGPHDRPAQPRSGCHRRRPRGAT